MGDFFYHFCHHLTAFLPRLGSRIYRVGILMYGKKPNLPEILRWLKYS